MVPKSVFAAGFEEGSGVHHLLEDGVFQRMKRELRKQRRRIRKLKQEGEGSRRLRKLRRQIRFIRSEMNAYACTGPECIQEDLEPTLCLLADLNNDLVLDESDATLLIVLFVQNDALVDLNRDGRINRKDLSLFLSCLKEGLDHSKRDEIPNPTASPEPSIEDGGGNSPTVSDEEPTETVGNSRGSCEEKHPICSNLGKNQYYEPEELFINYSKISNFRLNWAYLRDVSGLQLDEDGYVISLPESGDKVQQILLDLSRKRPLYSEYYLAFDGEASVSIGGGVFVESDMKGWKKFRLDGGSLVYLEYRAPYDHVRNIRVVPVALIEDFLAGKIVNPAWLDLFANEEKLNLSVLRFMDLLGTNNSNRRTISDLPAVSAATYSGAVPIEALVEIANEANAHPWFTIYHKADDALVRSILLKIRDGLAPHLRPYLEYSNEVWNAQFEQFHYADAHGRWDLRDTTHISTFLQAAARNEISWKYDSSGRVIGHKLDDWVAGKFDLDEGQITTELLQDIALGGYASDLQDAQSVVGDAAIRECIYRLITDKNNSRNIAAFMQYHAKRTVEIAHIAHEVFTENPSRPKIILGAQTVNSWLSEKGLDCPGYRVNGYFSSPCGELGIDGLAITTYFGGYLLNDSRIGTTKSWIAESDGGVSKTFQSFWSEAMPELAEDLISQKEVADKFGLELIAYEGGNHLTENVNSKYHNDSVINDYTYRINRAPEMRSIYHEMATIFQAAGGTVLCHFNTLDKPDKYGHWGLLEDYFDSQSPKFLGLQDFVRQNDCWFEDCSCE